MLRPPSPPPVLTQPGAPLGQRFAVEELAPGSLRQGHPTGQATWPSLVLATPWRAGPRTPVHSRGLSGSHWSQEPPWMSVEEKETPLGA